MNQEHQKIKSSPGPPTAVPFFPGWCTGPEVLDALHSVFTYAPCPYWNAAEPDRASGPLCRADQDVPWPDPFVQLGPQLLAGLKNDAGITFTVVYFQAYLNGSGCDWHRDTWDKQAILSLGVTRTFGLRCNGEEFLFPLRHGDLLVMPSGFQRDWEHSVIPEEVQGERCSLVFRSQL